MMQFVWLILHGTRKPLANEAFWYKLRIYFAIKRFKDAISGGTSVFPMVETVESGR